MGAVDKETAMDGGVNLYGDDADEEDYGNLYDSWDVDHVDLEFKTGEENRVLEYSRAISGLIKINLRGSGQSVGLWHTN